MNIFLVDYVYYLSFANVIFPPTKYVGLQNLIQRNEQLYSSGDAPSGGVALPFILVQVELIGEFFVLLCGSQDFTFYIVAGRIDWQILCFSLVLPTILKSICIVAQLSHSGYVRERDCCKNDIS